LGSFENASSRYPIEILARLLATPAKPGIHHRPGRRFPNGGADSKGAPASYFGVVKDIDENAPSNVTAPLPSVMLPEHAIADSTRDAIGALDLVPHRNGDQQ
jgi:hypothetical protein